MPLLPRCLCQLGRQAPLPKSQRLLPMGTHCSGANCMSSTRSYATRALHLSLLLVIISQLLSSQVMERPFPGDEPGWPFFLHEWIGLAGVGVITLFWLWSLVRNSAETPLSRLFPRFSPKGLSDVAYEMVGFLRDVFALRMPSFELDAIASAVHGLGLMLASFLALSGAAWYFVFSGAPFGKTVTGLHSLAGSLMWVYLIGHASTAILHQLAGDDVLSGMFWFRRRTRRVPAPAE
ncbi:MAG: cytochrome b/b6 domain-containing protein [Bradyrhizobium sp.]|nr:MAG: cytochrome b/b6 domain-containing protein [Bradyrhizobium sp.]